jgi:hypothetical protein
MMTTTDLFDVVVELIRVQSRRISPSMCDWCGAIGFHESYCSVYDDPLTNYEMGACEECGGLHMHVEGCSNVERGIKFIERTEESC